MKYIFVNLLSFAKVLIKSKQFRFSLMNTLYFNFKVLPFFTAIKLPILIGKKMQFVGLKYASISFLPGIKPDFGIVKIGMQPYPISPTSTLSSLLRFENNSKLMIGKDINIYTGCSLCIYKNALLVIKNGLRMNQSVKILAKQYIELGEQLHVGWESQIYDSSFHILYDNNRKQFYNPHGKIIIGNSCWIGNRCTISGNVYFPANSILGAGSLLNKRFEDINTLGNFFVGQPATLKSTDKFRVFNVNKERELLGRFENEKVNVLPAGDDFNILDYQSE